MQISELSRQSGVPAKTIRYYESVGLLPVPARADNNYGHYDQTVLERLRFIASARSLGFALADIGALLAARDAGDAPCERVLDALDAQLATLDWHAPRDLGGHLTAEPGRAATVYTPARRARSTEAA